MTGRRVVLVPGALALLPEHAGQQDLVAGLRAACRTAVVWLCEPGETVAVRCEHQSLRLARHLVGEAGGTLHLIDDRPAPALVIDNGSARRTEKAPGHLRPARGVLRRRPRRDVLTLTPAGGSCQAFLRARSR